MLKCLKLLQQNSSIRLRPETAAAVANALFSKEENQIETLVDINDFYSVMFDWADRHLPREELLGILERNDFLFEYNGYLSSEDTIFEPPRRFLKGVFGNNVLSLLSGDVLALREQQFESVTAGMTPHLKNYVMNLIVMSQMRHAMENNLPCFLPTIFGRYKSDLEMMSHIHFCLKLGNERTTRVLLQKCSTLTQIETVMKFSRMSGLSNTMDAARRVLEQHASRRLFFQRAYAVLRRLCQ
ncbi:hypothetical protein ADEAN_000534900 [Angomonas deanei]|uniref:Uncharacterized protein n=1 Tax=Angomonas deanei TaxID=59799 RepID=A0A7G2CGN8_9TRYP|nr:hypothetical protein ADEAN_000534900 [Angomonas deanei]